MIREQDARNIATAILTGDCTSVIGFSNMGKSTLLREMCTPDARTLLLGDKKDAWLFVYVDCNLMPERSEQALHEATLRAVLSTLRREGASADLMYRLNDLYSQVVEPAAPIRSPLAFDDALREVCEESGRGLAILFDEFDDPFEKLAGRAYLNLRGIKDQFRDSLVYVAATERPLAAIRDDHEASEFIELFNTRERWIGFLSHADARAVTTELAQGATTEDIEFIVQQAGGHSGLIDAVTGVWQRIAAGTPENARKDAYALAQQTLDNLPNVRAECAKLWSQLTDAERSALTAHLEGKAVNKDKDKDKDKDVVAHLRAKRLLQSSKPDADDVMVGDVWRAFVKRQMLTQPNVKPGILVDVDSGEVYVDGHKIEALTELEYKLLLLLYGRLNKIVDKYTIVTNVWGETYLDSVDDARIEKLVSRLRNKLEPGANEPKYLTTLRGRGYKLVG